MIRPLLDPDAIARPPEGFRDALAELVQIGLSVARMVGQVADAETALAVAAAQIGAPPGEPALAGSLAEAIEADRASAAAAEAQQTAVARTEAVTRAFARVSRAIRLTIHLAERLDRGWARRSATDDRQTMARRQIARDVADAIAREGDAERAERLTEALATRLESPEIEAAIAHRPVGDIVREICRDLGLDPARMTKRPPLPEAARPGAARWTAGETRPPQRRPDG